jgi:4'-phosphopantetheinyl transferase
MPPGDVRAWYADIRALDDPARRSRALAWLTPAERARFDRYRFDADRLMFALGRVMARRLVGHALGVAPAAWQWREGPHGRPEIASPETALHFNLAHSAGLVACVLAAGREVGVDVEDRERRATDPAMVPRFCSPEEAADIDPDRPDWRDRFLTYWTLKEAYLKARGLGIAVHLSDISFSIGSGPEDVRVSFHRTLSGTDTGWAFRVARPSGRHIVAVAASTASGEAPAIAIEPLPADWLP